MWECMFVYKEQKSSNLSKFICQVVNESLLCLRFANHGRHFLFKMTDNVSMYLGSSSTFHKFIYLWETTAVKFPFNKHILKQKSYRIQESSLTILNLHCFLSCYTVYNSQNKGMDFIFLAYSSHLSIFKIIGDPEIFNRMVCVSRSEDLLCLEIRVHGWHSNKYQIVCACLYA